MGLGQLQRRFHRVRPGRPAELQAVVAALARQQAEQGFAEGVLDHGGQVQSVHGQARGQETVETGHDRRVVVPQGQGAGAGQAVQVGLAFDVGDPDPMRLGDGQWQLARVTAHIGFELALPGQIVGIGFLQRTSAQYAIIQHLFTLVKFDMQIIIINKNAQLLIQTYLE